MAIPRDLTNPQKWTSTYNQSFRDRKMFISPHSAQPMYHFANAYDPSHYDGFSAQGLAKPTYTMTSRKKLPPLSPQANLAATQPRTPTPQRDLYATKTRPLSGVYSNQGLAQPNPADVMSQTGGSRGYGGFSTYDSMAMSRALDNARSKYHIPGYQGFVRGEQFRHGETFGRTTRRCLDVPTSIPLLP